MPEKGDIHIKGIKRTTRATANITFISYLFRYHNAIFKEINHNSFLYI